MRCLALASEADRQGWDVRILGDIDQSWLTEHRVDVPADYADASAIGERLKETISCWRPDVVHVDAYSDVPIVKDGEFIFSNMADGDFGSRQSDLAIDPTLGADHSSTGSKAAVSLLGAWYAPLREQVIAHRPPVALYPGDEPRPWRVMVVMGGTDPFHLTQAVIDGVLRCTVPVHATVVTSSSAVNVGTASKQRVRLIPFSDNLPSLATRHDLVISAAGTSLIEFAYLGLPMALVCAADNQRAGYEAAVNMGVAIPLGTGTLLASRVSSMIDSLHAVTLDHCRQAVQGVVDEFGAWRIVSAWQQLAFSPPRLPVAAPTMRRATIADAQSLFQWRDDPVTRAQSRDDSPLIWQKHVTWLRATLKRDDCVLLIAELDGQPVGTVRWDRVGTSIWEASVTIAPEWRGHGLAAAALAASEKSLPPARPIQLMAAIQEANAASLAAFARLGYTPFKPADEAGFLQYCAWRLT